jgi:hypothetical protein
MGYRGDDGARERAARGTQSPRQSSGKHADYDSTSYDAYGQGDGYGYGTAGHDSGSYETGDYSTGRPAATDGYGSHGYESGARYDSAGSNSASYRTGGTGGYPSGDYGSDGHGSSPYGSRPTSYESGAYDSGAFQSAPYDSSYDSSRYDAGSYGSSSYKTSTSSSTSGGYPTIGHPSGGYPALGDDSHDDGNDWYGRSGPQPTGFADTSAQIAVRDPVRGYPPEPARPGDGLAYTGQQMRYDESERVSYPGYDGVDDEYRQDARRAYDYDDYADYNTAADGQHDQRMPGQQEFETRMDLVAVDYDAPRGFGHALQGDDFDGGRYHDDYAGDSGDVLTIADTGARRGYAGGRGEDARNPGGPRQPVPSASRSAGSGKNGKPKRRRRALTYLATAAVVVLLAVAGVGGYKYWKSSQDSAAREANQPLPTTTGSVGTRQCAASLGPFCHIGLRTDDPAPLTLSEVYLPAFHSQADKGDFLLQTEKADTNCASALFGSQLISQVKTGKCTQVLRATYLSGDKTIMGTIGIVNLNTTNQAHYAGKFIGQNDFIQPLSTSKGLTAKLGQGIGVVEAEYKGHYLILTWAEFTNLKTPTTTQTQELESWENALVAGTANIYLSQRMIDGDTSAAVPSGSPTSSASTSPSATASATKA